MFSRRFSSTDSSGGTPKLHTHCWCADKAELLPSAIHHLSDRFPIRPACHSQNQVKLLDKTSTYYYTQARAHIASASEIHTTVFSRTLLCEF